MRGPVLGWDEVASMMEGRALLPLASVGLLSAGRAECNRPDLSAALFLLLTRNGFEGWDGDFFLAAFREEIFFRRVLAFGEVEGFFLRMGRRREVFPLD